MFDDFKPYIFKTTDAGRSWTNISGNLPAKAYVQVVREDPKNTNLLYAGTELGLFASYNGGKDWLALNLKNLPNVAVHDIVVHPRENDLILATHGRSIWIFDDATRDSADDAADPEQQRAPVLRAAGIALHQLASLATASATKSSPDRIRRTAR